MSRNNNNKKDRKHLKNDLAIALLTKPAQLFWFDEFPLNLEFVFFCVRIFCLFWFDFSVRLKFKRSDIDFDSICLLLAAFYIQCQKAVRVILFASPNFLWWKKYEKPELLNFMRNELCASIISIEGYHFCFTISLSRKKNCVVIVEGFSPSVDVNFFLFFLERLH